MKILALGFLLLACGLAHAGKQTVVLAADEGYPPYVFSSGSGDVKGYYVDLLNTVSAAMPNFKIEIQPYPWKRALKMAETGEVVGVFPPYKKGTDRPWMLYSEPLLTEALVAVCNKTAAAKYRGASYPAGFEGARFGNNLGNLSPGALFFDLVRAGKLGVVEYVNTKVSLLNVQAERVDCYVNDRRAIAFEVEKSKLSPANFVEMAVVAKEVGFIGYSRNPGNPAYQEAFFKEFNATLLQLRAKNKAPAIDPGP